MVGDLGVPLLMFHAVQELSMLTIVFLGKCYWCQGFKTGLVTGVRCDGENIVKQQLGFNTES